MAGRVLLSLLLAATWMQAAWAAGTANFTLVPVAGMADVQGHTTVAIGGSAYLFGGLRGKSYASLGGANRRAVARMRSLTHAGRERAV